MNNKTISQLITVESLMNEYSATFSLNLDVLNTIEESIKNLNGSGHNPKLTMLSFGGGQDSTTILDLMIKYPQVREYYAPNDLIVVMSDTSNEHPQTYAHVKNMAEKCKAHEIPFFFLSNDKGFHTETWNGLKQYYTKSNTCGSKAGSKKSCTSNLKIRPIYRFLEEYIFETYGMAKKGQKKATKEFASIYGKILVLVGIAEGENDRIPKPQAMEKREAWEKASIEMAYPLVDLKMDRLACQNYLKAQGEQIPLPSNCMLCHYVSDKELMWLERFYPEEFAQWVQFEQNKLDKYADIQKEKGKANNGVWSEKQGRLPEILAKAYKKYGDLSDKELMDYKMSHGHCVKNSF